MTTLSSKKCVQIKKKPHSAFAPTVAVTFGSAWPKINVAQVSVLSDCFNI